VIGMEWWTVALAFGVIARITRFLNSDTLAGGIRARVQARWGDGSIAADFVECPWCVSVWTSALVVPVAWLAGDSPWFILPALVLSLSYAYSLLAQNADD
jgi:hypothetical protein